MKLIFSMNVAILFQNMIHVIFSILDYMKYVDTVFLCCQKYFIWNSINQAVEVAEALLKTSLFVFIEAYALYISYYIQWLQFTKRAHFQSFHHNRPS